MNSSVIKKFALETYGCQLNVADSELVEGILTNLGLETYLKSLNVNLEVESIISLIADVEKEINKVDLELSQAEINFTKDNPLYYVQYSYARIASVFRHLNKDLKLDIKIEKYILVGVLMLSLCRNFRT